MRIKAIDTFRGLSIVLMVFFTIILALSNSLPWPLTHNIPGTLRPGDFVLPMFLFASGMSLVYFHRKKGGNKDYFLDIVERIGRLVMVWFFLSPISAGEFLGMDEVLLSAILFIPTIIMIKFSDREIMFTGLAIFLLYFSLQSIGLLPDFNAAYLGGYGGAVFYLPVMLAGVVAGRNMEKIDKYVFPLMLLSLVLLLITPPYKLMVSPSFMVLSVLVSILMFQFAKGFDNGVLQYLGKDPIRYWVLMFVVLGVPILIYAEKTDEVLPLELDWPVAAGLTIAGMVLLYVVSKVLDVLIGTLGKIEITRD